MSNPNNAMKKYYEPNSFGTKKYLEQVVFQYGFKISKSDIENKGEWNEYYDIIASRNGESIVLFRKIKGEKVDWKDATNVFIQYIRSM